MNVCVFCGSAPGARPLYLEAARALGRGLATAGHVLVYGGASVGTMGAIADAALDAGGRVIGVLPRSLLAREIGHSRAEVELVDSLAERKERMLSLSQAFVSLPGGYGTLDETFEVLTLAQLGAPSRPMILVDLDGFYRGLVGFVDHAVAEGMIQPAHRALLSIVPDVAGALSRL